MKEEAVPHGHDRVVSSVNEERRRRGSGDMQLARIFATQFLGRIFAQQILPRPGTT
jgi:hypothetical protein